MQITRRIACTIYPNVMSLDVVGPLQVFASANTELKRQGQPVAYTVHLLADTAGPVCCSAGFSLLADASRNEWDPASFDTVLVPGGEVDEQLANLPLLTWLQSAEPRVRRIGSVCSGALILAKAGLLDGRRATTHWANVEGLRNLRPTVDVDGDRLHTYDPHSKTGDDHVFTSAGVTAGIDLALALVESDQGRMLALAVARRLVMFMRRPGGQAQFSSFLAPEATHAPRLAPLLEWIPGHLADDLSMEVLAERFHMPARTLSRVFQRELGMTPGAYVERVRVEAAAALLAHAQTSVSTVARLCGFQHPENLRRTFHKYFSVSPQAYVDRFGASRS